MKIILMSLLSIAAFAQNHTVGFEAKVKRGGSPNYLQEFMLLVGDASKELGITATVRPGEAEGELRFMFLEVTGHKTKIESFRKRLSLNAGVSKISKISEKLTKTTTTFEKGIVRKYRVTSSAKKLGSVLETVKKTAGRSNVIFLDATPGFGSPRLSVIIQMKGQSANLDNFHSYLLIAKNVEEVEKLADKEQ